jgi:hypothetical protein
MNKSRRQFGFSLIEALLATGALGVGLVLIAMVFPVGLKLTTIAVDRTVGDIAADEAMAKVAMHGFPEFADWPVPDAFEHAECVDYLTLLNVRYVGFAGWPKNYQNNLWDEFLYPSAVVPAEQQRNVHWTALCRRQGVNEVQTTVFVTRKVADGMRYYSWDYNLSVGASNAQWPSPVPVVVVYNASRPRELEISMTHTHNTTSWGAANTVLGFFGEGAPVVANHNGRIYRVQEFKAVGGSIKNTLVLNADWEPSANPQFIWLVPPGIGSSRNPVIGVKQTTITKF